MDPTGAPAVESCRRGVYFLANDRVADLALAFLNSFRNCNPDIPLCLIPFDDDVDTLLSLESRYGFTVWADRRSLAACDEVSRLMHGFVAGHYRKLAMWDGPFDQFVYIDTDTVVLASVDFAFRLLGEYAFVTSHSDIPGIRKYVWKETEQLSRYLSERQIAFSANTGFIVSSAGEISLERVAMGLDDALRLRPSMELMCMEQPLLNYLMVTSGRPYTSLRRLNWENPCARFPEERWAGGPVGLIRNGQVVYPPHPRVVLVHWAGQWQNRERQDVPHYELWRYYHEMEYTGSHPRTQSLPALGQ
jgi:hypothetical protein